MLRIMHRVKIFSLVITCFIAVDINAKNKQTVVFIDPLQSIYYGDQLFVLNKTLWGKAREKFARAGLILTTDLRYLHTLDCYVVFNAPASPHAQMLMKNKKVKKILMAWEPPAVDPNNYKGEIWQLFDQVMTFHDEVLKRNKFKRLNYCFALTIPHEYVAPSEKKLCTLIASNKRAIGANTSIYSLRSDIVNFFIAHGHNEFDLWGHGWPSSIVYRGTVEDKLSCMSHYKFAFCFENSCIPGYITEKIFDAFSAGCVPIYLGAPNIDFYIPINSFINYRDFASLDDLYHYLTSMTDVEYEKYLSAARDFLQSPKARIFSYDAFIDTLLETVKAVLRK